MRFCDRRPPSGLSCMHRQMPRGMTWEPPSRLPMLWGRYVLSGHSAHPAHESQTGRPTSLLIVVREKRHTLLGPAAR